MIWNSLLISKNFIAKGQNYKLVNSNFYLNLEQNLIKLIFSYFDLYPDICFKRYNLKILT